jgi:hypothetical protein
MNALYTPLDSTREIRLLRLRSRSSTSKTPSIQAVKDVTICCDLYPVTIREARDRGYEALSYTWGSPADPLTILVNETKVPVTRNLHAALEHLREETDEIILWVDALCINQIDDVEKSEQVSMMKEIYEYAKNTRVWLGPADDTSDDIMAQLTEIGKAVMDRGAYDLFIKMAVLSIKDTPAAGQAEDHAKELLQAMFDNSYDQLEGSLRLLTRFCKLLSRQYWSRVWILQEIVVSKNVEVQCGKLRMRFAILHAAMLYIIYMQILVSTKLGESMMALMDVTEISADGSFPPDCELMRLEPQFQSVNSIDIPPSAKFVSGMRVRYHNTAQEKDEMKVNLVDLLSRTRVGREATDPRDRIWALLGIAGDTEALRISPNYADTNTCATVYCNSTHAMIASGHVDILAFSQWTKKDLTMPSWSPDWREEVKQPYGQLPWDSPYSGAGSKIPFKHLEQFNPVSHLRLNGLMVDCIESTKPQCNNGEWLSGNHRYQAFTYLLDIRSHCQISADKLAHSGVEIYADPSARERAYQRVPVADLYSTGFVRRAMVEECHIGHAEVITDYSQWQNPGLDTRTPTTNTFRSYYAMMGEQVERRPFLSVKGFVGLAPKHMEEGDVIVVFPGARFPYMLRKCDDGMYLLVGEAYVHGIMDGELATKDCVTEEFVLK